MGMLPIKRIMEYFFKSVQGKRGNLEDSYGNYKNELFIVADGVGGHPFGEVASKIAVETAIDTYKSSKSLAHNKLIRNMFTKAEQAIQDEGKADPNHSNMGTTMLTAVIRENNITFANLGDCRAYMHSAKGLEQITIDDRNDVGDLIKALGVFNERVSPQVIDKKIRSEDLVLMCSDGLHDFVSDKVIKKILDSSTSLDKKGSGLIEAALQFNSTDNVTVSLIKL